MKSRIAAKLALVMFAGIVNFCVFTACEDKDTVQPSLKLNREAIVIEGDTSAIVTFEINSNVDWKVQSYQGWLHVSPETGSGKSVVTVTVDQNNDGDARTGKAEVIAGNIKQSVSVSQSKTVNLSLTSKEVELKDLDNGDQVKFTVSSDADWTLASTTDWLTATPTRGIGGRTVVVTVAAGMNTTSGIRNGEIVFKTATRSATCSVRQLKGANRFSFGSEQVDLSDKGNYRSLRVISSTQWTVAGNDWIQVDQTTGIGSQVIKVSASENTGTAERTGTLTFSTGGDTREIPVVQGCAGNYWNHKDTILLNKHTVGSGVHVVIIGDGFDRVDNKKGDGIFEKVSRELAACLLKTNPLVKDLVDMFDVYAVVVESEESGCVRGSKTAFNSGVGPDFDAAKRVSKEANQELPVTASWIFVGHGMIGGYAYFGSAVGGGIGIYSTDEGVSTYWMAHEFTGHAFASLADEYVSTPGYMGGVEGLLGLQRNDQCWNVSVTNDLTQVPWKDFIELPGYEEVGAYEGGFYEPRGIWRPEEHSVMVSLGNEGVYYNAQSRWLIYERIHKVAGVPYSFESFLEFDRDKGYNVK
ncbi:MAG: hypothetical protein LBM08_15675 [Dysgonamonadaceae bacterium]|nr:hypothetical protein [Dysgonamonadaceae bacterium]